LSFFEAGRPRGRRTGVGRIEEGIERNCSFMESA
jgi:hypothetical protein